MPVLLLSSCRCTAVAALDAAPRGHYCCSVAAHLQADIAQLLLICKPILLSCKPILLICKPYISVSDRYSSRKNCSPGVHNLTARTNGLHCSSVLSSSRLDILRDGTQHTMDLAIYGHATHYESERWHATHYESGYIWARNTL